MIVPSVRVQSRVPGIEEKSLVVISFETNDLDIVSCHPLWHKRSVVNTLLKRANNIPSTNKGRREETQRVKAVLRDNNYMYPMSFIQNCERALTKPNNPPITTSMAL